MAGKEISGLGRFRSKGAVQPGEAPLGDNMLPVGGKATYSGGKHKMKQDIL